MPKKHVLSFPVVSFRHLETPFAKQGYRDYFAVVDSRELPDLSGWREINVRDPKMRGTVPTAIRDGFRDQPDLFLFMNRGLVLSAEEVHYDNKSERVSVTLSDPKLHGLLDGGHSYNIVREESEGIDSARFIKLEILTGFLREDITNVVDARNTSNQVKDESLMNLQGSFNRLKKALEDKPYYEDIAWTEYQTDNKGRPLPIDIREIISIFMCFDKANFGDATHPINAYRSKAAALKHFKANQKEIEKLYGIADDLLRLHDQIYLALPELYNNARKSSDDDVSGGKFGRLKGVTVYKGSKRATLHFTGEQSRYGVPSGFIYPLLGAFRSLLIEKSGKWAWADGVNPVELLRNGLGIKLATVLGNFALEDQNPSKTGKSPNVWQSCYDRARLHFLESRAA